MINDRLIADKILSEVIGSDYNNVQDIGIIMSMIGYDIPNLSISNLICEYLDIEKRRNRRIITDLLDKYNY